MIVTAANLFKPFHIDDTAHLEIARWIMSNPLHPMSGTLNWSGFEAPIHQTNQPHLFFYMLAGWCKIFGFSELSVHALIAIFALVCIATLFRIARSVAPGAAVWITAITVLGPCFIVEQNAMVDVPLLAFWLLFFEALICPQRYASSSRRYLAAALFCSAAILIKYSSVVLPAVLALSLLVERRLRQVWSVFIPVCAVLSWSLFNYLDYGGIHILERPQSGSIFSRVPHLTAAWVVGLGALTPVAFVMLWRRRWPVLSGIVTLAIAACLVLPVASGAVPDVRMDRVLLEGSFWAGLLVLLAIAGLLLLDVRDQGLPFFLRPSPDLYLYFWIFSTSAFFCLFAPFMASRHILLVAPAIVLLIGRRCDGWLSVDARRWSLALTAALSLALCVSDWRFAEFFRQQAPIIARSDAVQGRTVWFIGHWGWQWYASQAGFRQVDINAPDIKVGDIVVLPDASPEKINRSLPLTLLSTTTQPPSLLGLFCTGRSARFYAYDDQSPPWTLSNACTREISVYLAQ